MIGHRSVQFGSDISNRELDFRTEPNTTGYMTRFRMGGYRAVGVRFLERSTTPGGESTAVEGTRGD